MIAPFLSRTALKSTPLIVRPIRKYATLEHIADFCEDHWPKYMFITQVTGALHGGLIAYGKITDKSNPICIPYLAFPALYAYAGPALYPILIIWHSIDFGIKKIKGEENKQKSLD